MSKKFASQADLQKRSQLRQAVRERLRLHGRGRPEHRHHHRRRRRMVIDTQATPVMAQDVIRRIREVTDKPIKYVVLSHYHAVRVLGASAYGAAADHRQPATPTT